MAVSGRALILIGLGGVGVGAGISVFAAPEMRPSDRYAISRIDPRPVLEPWIEGQVTIDARDRASWVFFDFSRASVVDDAYFGGHGWDLAFQRYLVATNSGTTNPTGRGGAIKLGKDGPPERAPADGWRVDEWEMQISYNPVFSRWYRYHPLANGLVSRGHFYLVRTAEGAYAWLQFLSYQCPEAIGGGHGCVTFRYGFRSDFSPELEAP